MKLIEPATSVHEEFSNGFYYCKRQVDEQLKTTIEFLEWLTDCHTKPELQNKFVKEVAQLIESTAKNCLESLK